MNASDLLAQAIKNSAGGWHWCYVDPERMIELCVEHARVKDAARERDAALDRLAEIERIMPDLLLAWCEHDREVERELMERIVKLAQIGP